MVRNLKTQSEDFEKCPEQAFRTIRHLFLEKREQCIENSMTLSLILGGAAVCRCDKWFVSRVGFSH
jgi:hypothetical protein